MSYKPSFSDLRGGLSTLPDPADFSFNDLSVWVEEKVRQMRSMSFSPALMQSYRCLTLEQVRSHPMGPEADPTWRRFFLAVLVADWATYEKPVDRIDVERLKYIMSSAFRFFRVWGVMDHAGAFCPVGYTAWYPISSFIYNSALRSTAAINDRGAFLPLRFVQDAEISFAYVLNISILPALQNTPCARRMIRAFRAERRKFQNVRLLAVTVDKAGHKLSRLTGMECIGSIAVQGEPESLYATR